MNPDQQNTLLKLARESIAFGITYRTTMDTPTDLTDPLFNEERASFVTLEKDERLRGCIGSLMAHQNLATDIIQNAFKAAFNDPRFPQVTKDELDEINLSISVLTLPEPITFTDEPDLIDQIRPGIDGLILQDQGHTGTFLPSVWENIPDKNEFFQHLKQKAGLPPNHFSESLKCFRYETEYFSE